MNIRIHAKCGLNWCSGYRGEYWNVPCLLQTIDAMWWQLHV